MMKTVYSPTAQKYVQVYDPFNIGGWLTPIGGGARVWVPPQPKPSSPTKPPSPFQKKHP